MKRMTLLCLVIAVAGALASCANQMSTSNTDTTGPRASALGNADAGFHGGSTVGGPAGAEGGEH
ncbi:MAG TPA: hypothetical protein VGF73_05435 [Chthoniobacterales bacterium]